jgi:hypothetical protein
VLVFFLDALAALPVYICPTDTSYFDSRFFSPCTPILFPPLGVALRKMYIMDCMDRICLQTNLLKSLENSKHGFFRRLGERSESSDCLVNLPVVQVATQCAGATNRVFKFLWNISFFLSNVEKRVLNFCFSSTIMNKGFLLNKCQDSATISITTHQLDSACITTTACRRTIHYGAVHLATACFVQWLCMRQIDNGQKSKP